MASTEILSKAYKQLNDVLGAAMVVIFIIAVDLASNGTLSEIRNTLPVKIQPDTIFRVMLYVLFIIICVVQYTALCRFAGQGLIRHNKAAGSVLYGIFLPLWCLFLLEVIFGLLDSEDTHIWLSALDIAFIVIAVVMIFALYRIANRAYNHAMNTGEDE